MTPPTSVARSGADRSFSACGCYGPDPHRQLIDGCDLDNTVRPQYQEVKGPVDDRCIEDNQRVAAGILQCTGYRIKHLLRAVEQ